MREKFSSISSKTLDTLDINDSGEYLNIVFDLCDKLDESLKEKYNKIICIAILEHVYNPFDAVKNLKSMLDYTCLVLLLTMRFTHLCSPDLVCVIYCQRIISSKGSTFSELSWVKQSS